MRLPFQNRFTVPALLACALPIAARVGLAQEVESSDYIRVLDQSDRGEMVFVIGPVDVPAGTSHGSTEHHSVAPPGPASGHEAHGAGGASPGAGETTPVQETDATTPVHAGVVPLQVVEFPRAGWVHGFVTETTDRSGAPLRDEYLHHVNVIDPANRELFSPISRRIMAAGPETGKKELPASMGLPVEAGQRLLVRAVFHNPTSVNRSDLYLRIRFSFTPSQAGAARAGVFPFYMDVKPPVGLKSFDLPPGAFSQSWEAQPAVSGRLLAAAGHMHQYGQGLRLEDATTGKLLWEVRPVTDGDGRIEKIPIGEFWKKGGIPIRSNHLYRLTVMYENPSDAVIPQGGMGTLGGVFLPEPGEVWPRVDPEDPDYLADLQHTRGVATEPMR